MTEQDAARKIYVHEWWAKVEGKIGSAFKVLEDEEIYKKMERMRGMSPVYL